MNNEKVLNLIGLAMRARKLVLGQDFVLSALKASPQSIIFLASDAGDNIVKKINNKAKREGKSRKEI